MIGSIYAHHPEILMHSFSEMNEAYAENPSMSGGLFRKLQQLYITVFGIPEIGFQVRSMHFLKWLDAVSDTFTPKRILDVGSGIGSYVFEMSNVFPQARIDGWDIDRHKVDFTRKFSKELGNGRTEFEVADITRPPVKKSQYDLVVSVDVLEHIKQYKKALTHMHMLLRPNGLLYFHTPHHVQKRHFRQFESWEHEDHVRIGFDPETVRRDLTDIGFTDISISFTFGYFGSLAWELNHMFLKRSMVMAGIMYPLLYLMSSLDTVLINRTGLCIAVHARKK